MLIPGVSRNTLGTGMLEDRPIDHLTWLERLECLLERSSRAYGDCQDGDRLRRSCRWRQALPHGVVHMEGACVLFIQHTHLLNLHAHLLKQAST